VAAASYLSVLGANDLRRVAAENIRRAKDLAAAIDRIEGFTAPIFNGAHFNEFVVRTQKPYASVHKSLLERGVHGGLSLARHLPELRDSALFATTGRHTPDAIERLVKALQEVR
jgi:glycine dehydrogenase subunit 1